MQGLLSDNNFGNMQDQADLDIIDHSSDTEILFSTLPP
jgi:hypothetical protein